MADEQGKFTPEEVEQENIPQHFRENVSIAKLPYIFDGDIFEKPAGFKWSVIVPNWEALRPNVEEMLKEGGVNPGFEWFTEENLSIGRVGALQVEKVIPTDQVPAIGISRIQSETSHLPPESGYNNVSGIGSFLLDNLCALADMRQWRIFLQPYDRGGRLTQTDLYNWYRRRGFEHRDHDSFGSLQRLPKEADASQVIAKILETKD